MDIDTAHDEIAVANNGDNSVLIFRRTDGGDVGPVRTISGERTGIDRPMGVAIDRKNNELWVAILVITRHWCLIAQRRAMWVRSGSSAMLPRALLCGIGNP